MPIVPSGQQVALRSHGQELVVVNVGGGIRSYNAEGRRVIQGYAEDEMCSGGRGQLLAPWPNRLDGGTFEWNSKTHRTPLSEAEKGNAIHGLVRWSVWTVGEATDDRAVLTYRHYPQPGWPWCLDYRVEYRLTRDGLIVGLRVVNREDHGVPFGAGWHPYLDAFGGRVDDVALTVPAAVAYEASDRAIPTGTVSVSGTTFDFTTGKRIGSLVLDKGFTELQRGSDGRAVVTVNSPASGGAESGPHTTELWVDESYTHLVVFSGDTLAESQRRTALAVEPMTCAPNALRSGDGLRTLEPGAPFDATWGLRAGR